MAKLGKDAMRNALTFLPAIVLLTSFAALADPHYGPAQNGSLTELQYKALYCGYFVMPPRNPPNPGQCPLYDKVHTYLNGLFVQPVYARGDVNPVPDYSHLTDRYGRDFASNIAQGLCQRSAQPSQYWAKDKQAEINSLFSQACHAGCSTQVRRKPEECNAECDTGLTSNPLLKMQFSGVMERIYGCLSLEKELP